MQTQGRSSASRKLFLGALLLGAMTLLAPHARARNVLHVGAIIYPYATIQDALDVAVDNDLISVHPGTYSDDINVGDLNVEIVASNDNGQDVVLNGVRIVMDGNQARAGFGTTGFLIQGFKFTGQSEIDGQGPAPDYLLSEGRIALCTFNGSRSSAGGDGGAIRNWNGDVIQCGFTDCTASSQGGAIEGEADCLVVDCTFIDCAATVTGGAIMGCRVIDGCTFENCDAGSGGGAILGYLPSPNGPVYTLEQVSDCEFSDCTTGGDGGAIFDSTAEIRDCRFERSLAVSGDGGALFDCDGYIRRNVFIENEAVNGGAAAFTDAGLRIENCLFISNAASEDGGALFECEGFIQSCTFVANSSGDDGGALRNCNANGTKVRNNIFYSNSAGGSNNHMSNCNEPWYCLFPAGWTGGGSFNGTGNPNFASYTGSDPYAWDLHLTADSEKAIDKGRDLGVADVGSSEACTDDLDGNSRPVDVAGIGTRTWDRGAYEYQP